MPIQKRTRGQGCRQHNRQKMGVRCTFHFDVVRAVSILMWSWLFHMHCTRSLCMGFVVNIHVLAQHAYFEFSSNTSQVLVVLGCMSLRRYVTTCVTQVLGCIFQQAGGYGQGTPLSNMSLAFCEVFGLDGTVADRRNWSPIHRFIYIFLKAACPCGQNVGCIDSIKPAEVYINDVI